MASVVALAGFAFVCTDINATCRAEDAPPDFDRVVAPLLVRRCFDCHNATDAKGSLNLTTAKSAVAGGDSGASLVAGKIDESLLWQRVRDNEMPPKKPLTDAEKSVLKQWIASGAKWGTDPIDPYSFTSESRAGNDWWSLQPVKRPVVPGDHTDGSNSPIDRFIRTGLKAKDLTASPESDRRTLIRRLSFDLLGLPPTPEDVAEFAADTSPDAYERLVDRLLASPHYGERWARHWLDIVRFGESQGFERDKLRPNSWRYRDWVVRAWNDDMPYDEFARLQLAGDVLRPDDPSAIMATGFLVAGPYDEVGQTQQSEAMRKVVQQDELEDLLGATGQTFLGLTVNCARCHDHKFDPVRQIDYYRMGAALAGVKHGERGISGEGILAEGTERNAALTARFDSLRSRLTNLEKDVRTKILAERKSNIVRTQPVAPIARWDFQDGFRDSIGNLQGTARDGAKIDAGRLVLDGKGYVTTDPLPRDLRAKTLEVWLQLADVEQRGGGAVTIQSLDGATFDSIVFGERDPGCWMAGSNFYLRSESLHGPSEAEATRKLVHVALVYSADGTIAAYRDGQIYGKPYKSKGLQKFTAGECQIVFGLRHGPAGGNKHLRGTIDRAQLYDRALTPDEVAASANVVTDFVSPEAIIERLSPAQRQERERLQFEMSQLERQRVRVATAVTYAANPAVPKPTHVLRRGNPAEPQDVVTPGGVAALRGPSAEFALAADAPDALRRQALAGWIADRRQPLFARVLANRLWHYHFGVGIVETCNDFGFNGARPTHPELLDLLADELVRHDFQLKPIQRLIVTSATYRQASRERPDAQRVDAGNRLLWRRSPQRLEAEAVRDAMLAATGDLNEQFGGPGFEDFKTFSANSQFYVMVDAFGDTFHRRSLYRTWVRSGRSPFLDVFDCPDPSTLTPQRAVTTTPLQALSLLNNSFVLRTADRLAARLAGEAGDDATRQVTHGCQLLFGRAATKDELEILPAFVAKHGLSALCRVWLNSSEFVQID
jgi:mono/diheme cytochrome c family protein